MSIQEGPVDHKRTEESETAEVVSKFCTAGFMNRVGACKPVGDDVELSYRAIVEHYIEHRQEHAREELQRYCHKNLGLKHAIPLMARSECCCGKKHPHQWRIPTDVLEESAAKLKNAASELGKCSDFYELLELVEGIIGKIKGVGELTIYDIALRIGANLGVEPKVIYLHAGTRKGAKALGKDCKKDWISFSDLPPEFGALEAREVEDCLCVYKHTLAVVQRNILPAQGHSVRKTELRRHLGIPDIP